MSALQLLEHNYTEEETDKRMDIIDLSSDDDNTLSSSNVPYTLSLRIDSIESDKELTKFIKSCEKLVRLSAEYKLWLNYLHEVLNVNNCQVTGESDTEVSSEIHHHPISLYVYIKGIILKMLNDKQKFCSFDVAIKCMEEHFKLNVPFVYLLKSYHEKFHNGFMQIPRELINGNHIYFMSTYGIYLDEDEQAKINDYMTITKENCGWDIKIIDTPLQEYTINKNG